MCGLFQPLISIPSLDILAKENEVLKKTLEEKEMIVNVLQGEREELKVDGCL